MIPLKLDVALIKLQKQINTETCTLMVQLRTFHCNQLLQQDTVIVETNEIVEVGEIKPDDIYIPGILLTMQSKASTPEEHHKMMGDLWTETNKLAGVK